MAAVRSRRLCCCFIQSLLFLPLAVFLCWLLALWYGVGVQSSLAVILVRKRVMVALRYICYDCLSNVSLPHVAIGWSAVCDCGISLSNSRLFSM